MYLTLFSFKAFQKRRSSSFNISIVHYLWVIFAFLNKALVRSICVKSFNFSISGRYISRLRRSISSSLDEGSIAAFSIDFFSIDITSLIFGELIMQFKQIL